MYRRNHTKKTKQIVIELLKQNLSAKEIARQANKLCKYELIKPLTRNSVIGIKKRAGLCKPCSRPYITRKKRTNSYNKSLAYEEKPAILSYEEARKKRLIAALK